MTLTTTKQTCHCEERSDAAISTDRLLRKRLLRGVYPEHSVGTFNDDIFEGR